MCKQAILIFVLKFANTIVWEKEIFLFQHKEPAYFLQLIWRTQQISVLHSISLQNTVTVKEKIMGMKGPI